MKTYGTCGARHHRPAFHAHLSDAPNPAPHSRWLCGVLIGLLALLLGSPAVAGLTQRVSLATDTTPGNDQSFAPALSADGRVVAFTSGATNLVPGDSNGWSDILVHDRAPDAPTLALFLPQASFQAGQPLTLWAAVSPGADPLPADVYVAVQLPGGQLLFLRGDGSLTDTLAPIVTSWSPSFFAAPIFSYTFTGGEPVGSYAWLAAFTQPGTLTFLGEITAAPFSVGP